MDYVFITDLHFKLSSSVRTGILLDDLCAKLEWCVRYCNDNDAALLIGGDVFDTPSVPDVVKNRIAPLMRGVRNGVYGISGNHDRPYDNPEHLYKSSWCTLTATGCIRDLDCGDVDMGDVVLSSVLPVRDHGKPCIFVYHGFLNIEDGRNTFRFTDLLNAKDKALVLLGHDHKVYDDLVIGNSVIVRPGSFQRQIRADESMRCPQLVHIRVNGDGFSYNKVDIGCARDCGLIFVAKEGDGGVAASEVKEGYAEVIGQLRDAAKTELTFDEALRMVADDDVRLYVLSVLKDAKMDGQFKKKNI